MVRVAFKNVSKHYNLINTGGIKSFIFNFFKTIKTYKENRFQALEDINFTIYDKEIVGIIGRNGAGKSTTLGLIANVLAPSVGCVEVNGKIAPLLELGAGFHMDLTGRENITLNALLLGLTKEEIALKIDDIIEFSELEEFIDQPMRMYSTGMIGRLGFSIAIQVNADILLIDEVLSVGDQKFQQKCTKKINEFKKSNMTIILVTHSIGTVEELCDKVIWIEDHKIKKIGLVEEIAKEYKEMYN